MKPQDFKIFYRQDLPHWQPIGATFFVTFRLQGSMPQDKLTRLREIYQACILKIRETNPWYRKLLLDNERKLYFEQYEKLLDLVATGPHYLKQPEIASIVQSQLHRFDGDLYELVAYCIMSNHVHILIDTSVQLDDSIVIDFNEDIKCVPLQNIMKRIKGPSAIYANRTLGRSGKFWQRESFDHVVRSEKSLGNITDYILQNPVKAGVVESWEHFPFSYIKK